MADHTGKVVYPLQTNFYPAGDVVAVTKNPPTGITRATSVQEGYTIETNFQSAKDVTTVTKDEPTGVARGYTASPMPTVWLPLRKCRAKPHQNKNQF